MTLKLKKYVTYPPNYFRSLDLNVQVVLFEIERLKEMSIEPENSFEDFDQIYIEIERQIDAIVDILQRWVTTSLHFAVADGKITIEEARPLKAKIEVLVEQLRSLGRTIDAAVIGGAS